jgi:hypothetical protein
MDMNAVELATNHVALSFSLQVLLAVSVRQLQTVCQLVLSYHMYHIFVTVRNSLFFLKVVFFM